MAGAGKERPGPGTLPHVCPNNPHHPPAVLISSPKPVVAQEVVADAEDLAPRPRASPRAGGRSRAWTTSTIRGPPCAPGPPWIRCLVDCCPDTPAGDGPRRRGSRRPSATSRLTSSRSRRTRGCCRKRPRRPPSISVHIQSTAWRRRRGLKLAALGHHVTVPLDRGPEGVDARPGHGAGDDHGRRQWGEAVRSIAMAAANWCLARSAAPAVDVGLVDDDDVGQLDDPSLDRLQVIAGVGELEQHEDVDHAGHGRLRLADADGLDEDHVEPGRLAHQHRLARLLRHAAERAAGRRGPDERGGRSESRSMRVLSPRIEPPGEGLEGSTASTATRWPRSIRCRPSASMKVDFPGAGRAGDAHADRVGPCGEAAPPARGPPAPGGRAGSTRPA